MVYAAGIRRDGSCVLDIISPAPVCILARYVAPQPQVIRHGCHDDAGGADRSERMYVSATLVSTAGKLTVTAWFLAVIVWGAPLHSNAAAPD